MYTAFSELFRKTLLKTADCISTFALSSFEYKGLDIDNKDIRINYMLQGVKLNESFEEFIKNGSFKKTPGSLLKNILHEYLQILRKRKTININQDTLITNLISIKNTETGEATDLFAKDIFLDDNLLERMPAKDIRIVAQIVLGINQQEYHDKTYSEKDNIIKLRTKDQSHNE